MPDKWTSLTVDELIRGQTLSIGDGYRAKNAELGSEGPPFARAGNINSGFDFSTADRVPPETIARVGEKRSRVGDVVFTSKGTVGRFAFVNEETEPFVFSPQLCYWRSLDSEAIDARFLYFWFHGTECRHQLDLLKGQTDMADYVSLRDQKTMAVTLPPPREQQAIASVLGALDDKIASNRRLASDLADVSLALGDQACRMAPTTTRLNEIVEQIRGAGDPARPYVGLDVMPKGSTILESWNAAGAPTGASWAFEPGDVLFGKLRPYFRKVVVAPISGRCSREILVLRPAQPHYYGLLVSTIASKAFIDYCTAISTGTKMPRAEWKDASNFEVGLPSAESLSELADLTRANYARAAHAIREARTLAAIRDALLPKLMSGEIRVAQSDDPEEQVDAATEALSA